MARPLTLYLAQINPVVGDIDGNVARAREAHRAADSAGADLLVLPELFLIGYPPEDLVLKGSAVQACRSAIAGLCEVSRGSDTALLVGTPWAEGDRLYNSAALLEDGELVFRYDKRELPNYGVFDELRLFDAGQGPPLPVDFRGHKIGIAICEDIWRADVPKALAEAGADLIIAPNASPWRRTVQAERHTTFSVWRRTGLPYVFLNQVGGQDELVFDGASYVVDGDGREHQVLPDFEEGEALVSFDVGSGRFERSTQIELSTGLEADYRAGVLALRDYVNKNRFPGVVLGLSGGIDSALTAAMSVDALGADRVWAIMLPSKFTSNSSLQDARACAEALGISYTTIPITPGVAALDEMLAPVFDGRGADVTEENIQSRLRGLSLMALSNKFGPMVVTTGNKSEMAVGYATLYGDMNGGYNALKDYYKTEVFALSAWRNAHVPKDGLGPRGEVIPQSIIDKPPSAELREDQRDDDSLPPYDILDDILRRLVDADESIEQVCAAGHELETVRRIEHLLYVAEYKRRQAPPGVKIGRRNFGRDRRYPITNRFRDR
ncbi:MAG: NAD+ synthase [Pseudomonadota bacterium]